MCARAPRGDHCPNRHPSQEEAKNIMRTTTPRLRRDRITKYLRPLHRAGLLVLCTALLAQGFVFGPAASLAAKAAPASAPRQEQGRSDLQAETTTISSGAINDQEIQSSSRIFKGASKAVLPVGPDDTIDGGPSPGAPGDSASYDAINFDENTSLTGFFQIPPDPAGAVGTNHLVNVVNSSIEFYSKQTGARQFRQSLKNFFATAPTPPLTTTFDPKVVYDQYANRFVVMTMERIEASGMTPNQSRVYFAVSDDSDPNGTWFFHTLNTEEVINTRQTWADFPGLAVDSEAVYFTNNQFAHNNQTQAGVFQGQRLRIFAKAPWYTGGAAVVNSYNPTGLANAVPGTEGAVATTMQPTQMYGDTPGGLGTFLIAYSGLSDGVNNYIQVIRVDNPLAAPTFTVRFSLWGTRAADDATNLALPPAPQKGTNRTIATNDRRFSQHGVYRNGLLYCAAPIRPPVGPDASQTTVRYFVINPVTIDTAAADPPPTDQGNIGAEEIGAGTHTFFPSVAVDSLGNLGVSFAGSGPTIYPGSYFAGRRVADAPGTTLPAHALRQGVDYYVRAFSTSTSPAVTSRWGDYTGIWLDPSNETNFYVYNEHALTRGTIIPSVGAHEDGRWGTAWGSFTVTAAGITIASDTGLVISELRLRGPAGVNDEFIELYNDTDSDLIVTPTDASAGYAVVASDGSIRCTVPALTNIPARGHWLCANSTPTTGYSLTGYPAGEGTTATPDATYTADIPDNAGIALFNTANTANFTLANRIDAVGSTAEANALYREGAGYPVLSGAQYTGGLEYAFVRDLCGKGGSTSSFGPCPTGGRALDTNDNAVDFFFVDTQGMNAGAGQRLGAPGPENLSSPVQRNDSFPGLFLDSTQSGSAPPNRERTFGMVSNGTFGTLSIRRRIVNGTGETVTRLRFRVIDISTAPAPSGIADLRALTSSDVTVSGINDAATCATAMLTPPCSVTVQGTTLETPPAQSIGGGFNATLSVSLPGGGLANGDSVNVQFQLGIMQTGRFKFYVNVEALTETSVPATPADPASGSRPSDKYRGRITEVQSPAGGEDGTLQAPSAPQGQLTPQPPPAPRSQPSRPSPGGWLYVPRVIRAAPVESPEPEQRPASKKKARPVKKEKGEAEREAPEGEDGAPEPGAEEEPPADPPV